MKLSATHPMNISRTIVIRFMLFFLGLIVGLIGVKMLLPFLDESETYTHTKKAFYMSIIFILSAGYYIALSTMGFEGFKNSKAGKRILLKNHTNETNKSA